MLKTITYNNNLINKYYNKNLKSDVRSKASGLKRQLGKYESTFPGWPFNEKFGGKTGNKPGVPTTQKKPGNFDI